MNAGYLWRWLVSPELLDVQVLDEVYARQNGKFEYLVSRSGEFWGWADLFGGQRKMRGAWRTWKQSASETSEHEVVRKKSSIFKTNFDTHD